MADGRPYISSVAPLWERPQAAPPSSNRGESREAVDLTREGDRSEGWLSQTVNLDAVAWVGCLANALYLGGVRDPKKVIARMHADQGGTELVAQLLLIFFGLEDAGLRIDGLPGPSRLYAFKVRLVDRFGKFAGMIEFAGEHTRLRATQDETYRIELTGTGCAQYEGRSAEGAHRRSPWARLRAKLEQAQCWLTRVDVACDLYDGTHTVAEAESWWEVGRFDNRGQRPHAELVDDKGSGKGCTLYIGSKQSPKFLRVYEKGKQLGDKASPWVRFEMQLRNAGGRIDLGIITEPASAMRAAYPSLTFIAPNQTRAFYYAERAKACALRCLRALKHTFGPTIGHIQKHAHDAAQFAAFCGALARDVLPEWSKEPLRLDEWPAVLAESLRQTTTLGEQACFA